jgi:hypothetical protein
MESFAKIFVWFVILGTYFLCAFSTDLLWLGQTGVAFLVFCITFSILNEIIDDYLAINRWKISWISLTLVFVFSFIFYFSWEQKITTYIFGALTLITFLVWITKIYQIKIKKPIFIKNKPTMKKKIGILLILHATLGIFNGLYHYGYSLRMLKNPEVFFQLLSLVIFISLEFLIANLLINGLDSNISNAKKTPPIKKAPAAKKTPPIKKVPAAKKAPTAKKTPPIKKAPAAKTKPAIKKVPASRKIKLNPFKNYNQTQKDILLKTYSSASKQQQISIIYLFASILKEEKPTKSDFEKLERELDLFNFKMDLLSGYNGWDGIVKDLNPLPTSLKEFIFINSMEFMYVDGKLSQKRMNQAEKVFSRIGISSDKAMEILGKHKAFRNNLGL